MRSLGERKHRRALKLCLVEGVRLVEEALASRLPVDPILYAPERLSSSAAGRALRQRLERVREAEEIDEHVLAALSDTGTSQGVVAAVRMPDTPELPSSGLLLVLDGIADPGNAGSILRTARAAGVAAVLATKSTTDVWSPKALRAGMGAHFHLPLVPDALPPDDRPLWLATAHGGVDYRELDWPANAALAIGSEAHGASSEVEARATGHVTIPMAEGAESLNAAAAAAVLLFAAKAKRQ